MGILAKLRAAKVEAHPGPYTIEVTENIGTTGAGTTNGMRYRFVVKDANGAPVKVGYGFTYRTAYASGQRMAGRLTQWKENYS